MISMCNSRIVVRIEISTLSNEDGKFDHQKMDRLAMVLSNLNNSGKQVIVVSSGAIALGADKMGIKIQPKAYEEMQVIAAIGQAELIKSYQHYFDQYNQIVAQVLLTDDIMDNPARIKNTKNTFNTLLDMNIIPVVNENDAVCLTDIKLDDNYTLALQVAKITKADIILIKMDANSKFIIQPRTRNAAVLVSDERELFDELDKTCREVAENDSNESYFPQSIGDIIMN
jgi:glutamate 5-kinase